MIQEVTSEESCFETIPVTQNDAAKTKWRGVPSFYELRDNLFATLTPASVENITAD